MEAKELRIGNYLKTDRECQDDYVEVVEIYNENYFCTCSAGLNYQKEHVKPIPLTEEWLVRFGIKKINNSMFRSGALTFQGTTLDNGGELHDRIITSRRGFRICLNGKFLVNLEHVHQLQNLYYSLTQKELIWKKYT